MSNKKGFTLIELAIVLAIIGILVLLATTKYKNHIQKANDIHAILDTRTLEGELKSQLSYEDKEYTQKEIVDKDSLKGKTIYSSRGKQEEEIPDKVYKIEQPKEYTNTVLTGTFFADKTGTVYYTPEEVKTKPDTPEKPDKTEVGTEELPEEPKIPNGLYRMYRFDGETELRPQTIYGGKASELSSDSVYGGKYDGTFDFDYLDVILVTEGGKKQTLLIDHSNIDDYPIVTIVGKEKGNEFILEDSKGHRKTYLYNNPMGHIPGGYINFDGEIIQFKLNDKGDEIEYISRLDKSTPLAGELK